MKSIIIPFIFCLVFSVSFSQVANDNESNFPQEGSISESTWNSYLLQGLGAERTLRLGVSNDGYTRGEIEIENNNTSGGSIHLKTTNTSGGTLDRMFIANNGNIGMGTTNPSEKLQIGNTFAFHDSGHKVLGILYSPSGGVDLDNTKYSAEIRFDPTLGNLRLGTSSSITNNPTTRMTIDNSGNVGIGTGNPHAKLTVNGDISSYGTNARIGFNTYDKFNINGSNIAHYGMSLQSINSQPWVAHSGYFGQLFYTVGSERMRIQSNGNVGIGTTDTKGFKLGVNGKIAAEEVKIALYANWSDFVFKKDYDLPSLKEVEQHIKEKGHLKDIPSAEDVEKNGFFLANMNSKLLQKIEELTLYTIQQEKRINTLETENKTLKNQEGRITLLEEKLALLLKTTH